EPLCDISTHAENIDLTCLREGKKQMHRIDLRQASGLPQDIQSIATVRLHYLDAQKSLAVMNIEYR
ncbi:type 1 fimbrial protein, partial [Salmonella enterica]|nr:type 1 fimbrial protein [Salmonella enterica]